MFRVVRQQYAIFEADDQGRVTFSRSEYDNLDQAIRSERYHDVAGDGVDADDDPQPDDVLIARQETFYDDRGRTYETRTYAVNPATGAVGKYLAGYAWYDAAGNTIKEQAAGSRACTKTVHDGLGRSTTRYVGYDLDETPGCLGGSSSSSSATAGPDSGYLDATNVDGDCVVEQSETEYDAAGQVLLATHRQRFHNATGTGELSSPSGSQPKARASYVATWYDEIGRPKATADYGTNSDGSKPTRPDSPPESSDTVLVSTTLYNDAGQAYATIDPAGREDRREFDAAGRVVKTVQNYRDGAVDGDHPDEDVTVETAYNADGQVLILTARNPSTGDQVTRYVYGTTLSDSSIARADLLRAEIYPDSDDTADPLGDGADGIYDRVEMRYNRRGQLIEKKDQNGTIHTIEYDPGGRLLADKVTTVGSGVDDAVQRIARTYEVRGMVEKVTSFDAATEGNALNEVLFEYDEAALLLKEYQEHAGTKDANTLYVQYNRDESASNGQFTKRLRASSVRYPNGRLVHTTYGTAGSMGDALSRIDAINADNCSVPGDPLAQYSYLGAGQIVQVAYPEPELRFDLAHGAGDDPHDGPVDRFGRITDLLWRDYGSSTDAVRIQHGYDRAGNRLWREVPVAAANSKDFDELYTYDGMYQLATMQRGDLNANHDAISGDTKTFAEGWQLDMTGNWSNYKQDDDGDGTWDLDQSRTHNAVNEITQIAGTSTRVAHDRCGNMTKTPKPADWSAHFDLTYDGWNRLVKVEDGENTVAEYAYDGRNFRIVKTLYDSGEPSETRHCYYNNRWQCLEERLESGGEISANPDRQFVWGERYIDDLILRDRDTDSNGTLDERLYALPDPNWNVVAISDTNGAIQERFAYNAYGTPEFLTSAFGARASSSYSWKILFASYRHNSEATRYHVRNRGLFSHLGRWNRRDPVETDDNRYEYVHNNPVDYLDPLGLWKIKRVGKPTADATTEHGDIIDALGPLMGLDPSEFREWLTIPPGMNQIRLITGFSVLPDDIELGSLPLCAGQRFEIPNSMLSLWYGELGAFGKFMVNWYIKNQELRMLGFNVAVMDMPSRNALLAKMGALSKSKELHGWFVTGHGSPTGFGTGGTTRKKIWVYYSQVRSRLKYHLAAAVMHLCYGGTVNPGETNARDLVSPYAIFYGVDRIFIPMVDEATFTPFTEDPYVGGGSLWGHGEQGTNPVSGPTVVPAPWQ